MQTNDLFNQILNSLDRPAFFVKEELIIGVNKAAEDFSFTQGSSIYTYLEAPKTLYRSKWESPIELKVHAGSSYFTAHISRVDDMQLFILDHITGKSELKALQLAAIKLRSPLFDLMNAIYDLDKEITDEVKKNRMHKYLYQLDRLVVNMDCAYRYRENMVRLERTEMRSFLTELLESIKAHLDSCEICFQYEAPQELCFCALDPSMFTNALLNMVTNALESEATEIKVNCSLTGGRLRLSVIDNGNPVIQDLRLNMFNRFAREPVVADNMMGLGLGMVIIHATAISHNGSLFMDTCNVDETRVTLTIPIADPNAEMKQPRKLILDKTGGLDMIKVHLSAFLPPDQFKN